MRHIKIVVVLALFFLSSSYALSEDEHIFDIIIGEESQQTITVMTTNISKERALYGLSVERQESDKWIPVRGALSCPCRSLCAALVAPTLDINKSVMAQWNYLDDMCAKVKPGFYRFVSYGKWSKKLNRNILRGRSEPFEIK